MAVSEVNHEGAPAPRAIRWKLLRRFYEPIALEVALKNIRPKGFSAPEHAPNTTSDNVDNAVQVFRCFINRLALVCDNKRGGTTVSAIALLDEPDGLHYIVGSNCRGDIECRKVEVFAKQLINLIADPGTQPDFTVSSTNKAALWHVLRFNKSRIQHYHICAASYLGECIENYDRRYSGIISQSSFRKQLSELQQLANFQKDDALTEDAYFTACERLFSWIHRARRTNFGYDIAEQAKDGQIDSSKRWIELKHFLHRFHSYFLAVETMVRTSRLWSRLFHDVKVTVIPSATRIPHPLRKSRPTSFEILGRMMSESESIANYKAKLAKLDRPAIDQEIFKQCTGDGESQNHVVHAEVLVLDHVLKYLKHHDHAKFWNDWLYIGSSKPTCRLCDAYFAAHPSGVKVQESHNNIYHKWRLPDVYDSDAEKERESIMNEIVKKIRADVLRSIDTQTPKGRPHDSNCSSDMPLGLRSTTADTASINNIISGMAGLHIPRTIVEEEDVQSIAGNGSGADDDDDAEDDDEHIVFRGRRSLSRAQS